MKKPVTSLLRELSDDEDEPKADIGNAVPNDPSRPWLQEFRSYLDTLEHVPDDWTIVMWWGVRCHCYLHSNTYVYCR
jgi:hypothetical protein